MRLFVVSVLGELVVVCSVRANTKITCADDLTPALSYYFPGAPPLRVAYLSPRSMRERGPRWSVALFSIAKVCGAPYYLFCVRNLARQCFCNRTPGDGGFMV